MFDLLKKHGLDLPKDYQRDNNKWLTQIESMYEDLSEWELMYAGKQTFSLAFDPLINYVSAKRKQKKDLDGRTVNMKSRYLK